MLFLWMLADAEWELMSHPDLFLFPKLPKVSEKFFAENVYYVFNKSELQPESYPPLGKIVRMYETNSILNPA